MKVQKTNMGWRYEYSTKTLENNGKRRMLGQFMLVFDDIWCMLAVMVFIVIVQCMFLGVDVLFLWGLKDIHQQGFLSTSRVALIFYIQTNIVDSWLFRKDACTCFGKIFKIFWWPNSRVSISHVSLQAWPRMSQDVFGDFQQQKNVQMALGKGDSAGNLIKSEISEAMGGRGDLAGNEEQKRGFRGRKIGDFTSKAQSDSLMTILDPVILWFYCFWSSSLRSVRVKVQAIIELQQESWWTSNGTHTWPAKPGRSFVSIFFVFPYVFSMFFLVPYIYLDFPYIRLFICSPSAYVFSSRSTARCCDHRINLLTSWVFKSAKAGSAF